MDRCGRPLGARRRAAAGVLRVRVQDRRLEAAESGLGDWIDPYFINFLLEHWSYSISTFRNPLSPLMYFPVSGSLGYSHSLILYAPFYVVLRPFVDEFQAYTLALMLVLVTGTACLLVLLRRVGLGLVEALALGALFVTSSNVINGGTSIWSQTASVFLIPPILIILTASFRRLTDALRSRWRGCPDCLAVSCSPRTITPAHSRRSCWP